MHYVYLNHGSLLDVMLCAVPGRPTAVPKESVLVCKVNMQSSNSEVWHARLCLFHEDFPPPEKKKPKH